LQARRGIKVKKANGFTLIELMVVVAIIVVLAILALPSYLSQVRKARRSDVEGAIQQIALFQERFRADCTTYADAFAFACPGATTMTFPTNPYSSSYYTVTLPTGDGSNYTIKAAASSASKQNLDTAFGTSCANLYYTFGVDATTKGACISASTKTAMAAGVITKCPEPCWSK
jgi:type IV pilus assembly protein PilE